MYRPGALQSKSGPREPETLKGKEDACFIRSPHILSKLCVAGRFLVFFFFSFVVRRFSLAKAKPYPGWQSFLARLPVSVKSLQ